MRRLLAPALLGTLVGLVGLVGAGCGESKVDQLEDVRKKICACKTVACGEAALATVPQRDIKSTPQTQHVARAMLDCLATLYAAQQPSTDPDAPVPAGSGSAVTPPGTPAPASPGTH